MNGFGSHHFYQVKIVYLNIKRNFYIILKCWLNKKNALKRVGEEYIQLNISSLVNFCITVALFNDEYFVEWKKCTILGLKDTPYSPWWLSKARNFVFISNLSSQC